MLAGVNAFLDTDFSEEDMELIYTYVGNEIRHGLTMAFIDHDMSMKWLREHIPTERTSGGIPDDADDALVITTKE